MTESHHSANGILCSLLMVWQTQFVQGDFIAKTVSQSGVALYVCFFPCMLGSLFGLGKLPGFGVGCSQNPENGRVLVAPGTCGFGALSQTHSLRSISQRGIARRRQQPRQVA